MKLSLKHLLILLAFALVFTSCSSDKNSAPQQNSVSPDETFVMNYAAEGGSTQSVDTNPHRSEYDVVLVDGDGWELCMNHINTRYGVQIYDGILWFSFGSVESTYGLSAAYYPTTNTLLISSHEDYFTGGSILSYGYTLNDNVHNLQGFYHYMEHRYKSAPISGDLIQGSIGGYAPTSAGSSFTPSIATHADAKGGVAKSDD